MNSLEKDAKKDGKHLEQIMLTSGEWDLLQELILVLGPFEEATKYLGGEKYVTHSIMHPIIKEIKRILLLSTTSTSISTSPTLDEILLEIENADDVFVVIEEVEIQESISKKDDNQKKNKFDLNKPLETQNKLDEVKKNFIMLCVFIGNFYQKSILYQLFLIQELNV